VKCRLILPKPAQLQWLVGWNLEKIFPGAALSKNWIGRLFNRMPLVGNMFIDRDRNRDMS